MSKREELQLRVELSDKEAEEILTDAIASVPGFETPFEISIPERRLLIGAASLAIGDTEWTRALLKHMSGEDHLLLAARYFLWTADDTTMRAQIPKIAEGAAAMKPFSEMHEVVMALESIGAGTADARARGANAQRRLLSDYESVDCNVLSAGNAADTVMTFVHGMLGAAPDAPRGRLRMRVRLPDWIDDMHVHNLRLGDALIRMSYTREPANITYEVEQVAGAMPVRLIFEPTFTTHVKTVQVDDTSAELTMQPYANDRIVAPVQLMLDNQRTIRFALT